MKYKIVIILSFIIILALTGCQPEEPSESTPTTVQSEPTTAQRKPTNTQSETTNRDTSYPITTPTSQVDQSYPYPVSEIPSGHDEGPKFSITKPIKDGDTIIKGDGPAGVPIILVDVTELGTLLGETIINDEGVFRFDLDKPVQRGHTIGIKLGDISNTDINPADYQYSSTYYDRPQIGILFDMGNVE